MSYYIVVLIGWLTGVLVNYLADTLPGKRRLSEPFCQRCDAKLGPINYLIWPRRCASCGTRRPIRTWLVEVIFIAASLWLWHSPPEALGYVVGLALLTYLGVVTVIDIEHRLILHPVSLFGALLGVGIGTRLHGFVSTVIGGTAGFGIMLLLYYLGFLFMRFLARVRGQASEEEALGFGDVNLCGVVGLLLGWPGIAVGLVLTVLLAGIVSLVYFLLKLILRQYRPDLVVPYGPFLVASAIILLYLKDILLPY